VSSVWEHVEVLEEKQSMRLLESTRWGRLAWSDPEHPRILPINYSVLDASVYFRTDLYSSLADAADGRLVALEIDELDERLDSGWSVVLVGRADQVQDPAEVASLFGRMGQPFAPGSRPVLVRVVPTEITGRRFSR
jgi:uncharacterized protein